MRPISTHGLPHGRYKPILVRPTDQSRMTHPMVCGSFGRLAGHALMSGYKAWVAIVEAVLLSKPISGRAGQPLRLIAPLIAAVVAPAGVLHGVGSGRWKNT